MPKLEIYYFTQQGYTKLQKRLSTLEETLSNLMSQKEYIWEKCGDGWHDNFAFEELERQDKLLSGEIANVKKILNKSELVAKPQDNSTVQIGHKVKIKKDNTISTLQISGYNETDIAQNIYSYNTPLGKALLGAQKKEVVDFQKNSKITVLEILL